MMSVGTVMAALALNSAVVAAVVVVVVAVVAAAVPPKCFRMTVPS